MNDIHFVRELMEKAEHNRIKSKIKVLEEELKTAVDPLKKGELQKSINYLKADLSPPGKSSSHPNASNHSYRLVHICENKA